MAAQAFEMFAPMGAKAHPRVQAEAMRLGAWAFGGVCFIGLIFVPLESDDEPKTLRYANTSDCPMGADGEQAVCTTLRPTGTRRIRS